MARLDAYVDVLEWTYYGRLRVLSEIHTTCN